MKEERNLYVPFSTSYLSSKVHSSNSTSSADRIDQPRNKQKEREEITDPDLPNLRIVKIQNVLVVDYRTYGLSYQSPQYNESMSHCNKKIVKKLRLQLKAHTFDYSDPISISGFLTMFKLAWNANRVYEGAAMWAMPRFVADHVASSLNSRKMKNDETKGFATTVNYDGVELQALSLRPY